jgi:pimeloyl-ACP methyl ester carboxylesterase
MKITLARPDLRAIRWPDGIEDEGGIPVDRVKELVRKWNDFDFAAHERNLNALPHFHENGIHFVHLRATNRDATPLLLLHGWPGSFIEFLRVAPLLSDRFHLVIPSLPGYGFSEVPRERGMSNSAIADRMLDLMQRLGYDRFGVQGGDWGAGIATWMAIKSPQHVAAIHLNYVPGSYSPPPSAPPTEEEEAFLRDVVRWIDASGAYGRIQRTRPLTLAYGLNDSPVGLLAWIAEKFDEWSDPAAPVDDETILLNTTIYWTTSTIYSSIRLYRESVATPLALHERVPVPAGFARFALEEPFPPRSWVERGYDVQHWSEFPSGGHFAALEQPEVLARDIRAFFR